MIEESRKYQFISTDLRDGIFTVRLARPPVNVIHAPMMLEIADALDVAENDPGSFVVVITGSGSRAFSAGAEIGDHDREHIEELMENMKGFLTRLQTFPLPTIAALNAATLGGGLELALACDMIISVPEAKIGHPEIKLASIAIPGILMLQGRLPSNKIVEMLAGGEPIDGREAHRLGLVNQLIDAADFDAGVAAFAATFARMSRPVLQLMMRVLKGASGQTLQSGHDAAARIYIDELMPLDDVEEGLAAFAEKRSPIWKHG